MSISYHYDNNCKDYYNKYCMTILTKRGFYNFKLFEPDNYNMINFQSDEKIIDLSGCLVDDIAEITGKNIVKLNLDNNDISNIHDIDQLTNLETLILSSNPIKKLPNLMNYKKLNIIDIRKTNVRVIENIPDSVNSIIVDDEMIKRKDKEYPKIKELQDIPIIEKEKIIIENKTIEEIIDEIMKVKKLKKDEKYYFNKHYSTENYTFREIRDKIKENKITILCSCETIPEDNIHIIDIIGS